MFALASAGSANAAEPFWSSPSAARAADGRWRVSLEGESVGDTVEHAPNAAGGGFEPVREKPRYAAGAIALDWRPSSSWQLRARLGRRTMNFLRDSYRVDGLHLGIARRLPSPSPAIGLELVLDLDVNRADELYKNSWTEIGGVRLTGARLFDVRDDTLMASLVTRTRLRPATSVATLLGVGRVRTSQARLGGTGSDESGCDYRFEATADAGELELIEPCGRVIAFREQYASAAGVEARLGFSPAADLAHEGRVVQAGVALEHITRRVGLTLDYVYRRHDRGAFDERIAERGGRTVEASHTTSLRAGFAVGAGVGLSVGVHYRSTAYLDELPLLYNAFTNERFAKNTLSFGAGVTFSF